MDSRRFDIEADLQEIDNFISLSKRTYIKELLVGHKLKLEEEYKSLPLVEPPQPSPSSIVHDEKLWKAIDRFAWEQTDDDVKIYVSCLGDLKTHPKEKISVQSTSNSVEVSILDHSNANHKLRFPKLNKDIKSARITAKSNGFSLTLKKKDKGHWDNLVPKASALKKAEEEKKGEDDKDPGAGLMNMMKELYENGDDDMKRTIAEAWTKAKDKENP